MCLYMCMCMCMCVRLFVCVCVCGRQCMHAVYVCTHVHEFRFVFFVMKMFCLCIGSVWIVYEGQTRKLTKCSR